MVKVLIVDDAAIMRTMLKEILSKAGYEVVGEAANGREAITQYQTVKPDIVTLDITMPEMDGIQALKGIRSFDTNAKCVMCSAMGQQSMVIEAIQNGARDFIIKPFDVARVVQTINRVASSG